MNAQLNTHVVRETIAMPASQVVLPGVVEQTAKRVFDSFTDKMKQALNGRQEKALKMALEGHVTHKGGRIFSVRSEDGKHAYLVDLEHSFCTCPDSTNGHACKHRLAAYLIEQSMQASQLTSPDLTKPSPIEPEPANPNPPPTSENPLSHDEEAVERARMVLEARSQLLHETIIYAKLPLDGQLLPVEIILIEGEMALIRALPQFKDGQLIPQFPFPEKQSAALVLAKSLIEVRIYR